MISRLTRKRHRLSRQTADLMFAAPQVMGARLARMAHAGPAPSARDRREFVAMGTEKLAAFNEAWIATTLSAMRFNQAMAVAFTRAFWTPWRRGSATASMTAGIAALRRFESAALDAANEGIAPVRRRAVGNARRLSRGSSSRG